MKYTMEVSTKSTSIKAKQLEQQYNDTIDRLYKRKVAIENYKEENAELAEELKQINSKVNPAMLEIV